MQLTYIDEDDRAAGLAGMMISLATMDALDSLVSASLDAEGRMLRFGDSYYLGMSPAVSPKAVWETTMRNLHVTASLVLANIMSRSLLKGRGEIPEPIKREIYAAVEAEGSDACGLEKDEIRTFFDRTYLQQRRIFGNPQLRPAIQSLCGVLKERRDFTAAEIHDLLSNL